MSGKDVLLLGECLVGALSGEELDPEKSDKAQQKELMRQVVGKAALGDIVVAILEMRDDIRVLKGAMTK